MKKFITEFWRVDQSEESYENLLLESSSVSIHQRHLRFLVTEIYKSTTQINPEFMWPYFTYNNIPWFGIIFLGILNLANHYLNLKPKLRTLEVMIADV